MNNEQQAADLEAKAAEHRERAEESFQRCDTDGFLSQWASGIEANRLDLQAQVVRNGGLWEFPALFDLEGKRVPAKLIEVRDRFKGYGTRSVWAIVDPATNKFTGQFVSRPSVELYDVYNKDMGCMVQAVRVTKRAAANLAKKGFKEGHEMAPAKAEIIGTGHGLSGRAWAAVVRTDKGWVEGATYYDPQDSH